MSNILVTGGAGYIGSHACKALAAAGHLPVSYDNLVYGHRRAVKWGPLIEGDIADTQRLRELLKKENIDAVMHFAAFTYVGESMGDPGRYFRNNFSGALSLLDAMVDADVRKIVFSSTCATYGVPQYIPIDESHPQNPARPYGESKLFVERVLAWYQHAHGIRYAALRYFNAAGADPDGDIGEAHDPETHLIPLLIQTALGQRENVKVFGTDYATPDGTAVRDYVHVCDLAEAHVKAIQLLCSGHESMALNLGTGIGYSVRQVIKAVEKLSGRAINTIAAGRRAGDPPELVAQPDKAAALLNWRASQSDLESIVRTALAWHEGKGRI